MMKEMIMNQDKEIDEVNLILILHLIRIMDSIRRMQMIILIK